MSIKKFEYVSFQLSDKDLNVLGAKGWELVSHSAIMGPMGSAQYYVFKREIE